SVAWRRRTNWTCASWPSRSSSTEAIRSLPCRSSVGAVAARKSASMLSREAWSCSRMVPGSVFGTSVVVMVEHSVLRDSGDVQREGLVVVHVVVLPGDERMGVEAAAGLEHGDQLPASEGVRGVVTDRVEQPCSVLPVHTVQGAHVLLDLWADLVMLQVGGRGCGHDGATTDVVQVADHVTELCGAVVLGGVGEQLAGEVPAFRAGLCVGDRSFQARTHQRRVDDHFGDLVPDVRDALGPVGFCDELGQADEGVTDLDEVCRSTEALPQ